MLRWPRTARRVALSCAAFGGVAGCATQSPLPPGAFIREPAGPPQLPPPAEPDPLPPPPTTEPQENPGAGLRPGSDPTAPLGLDEVFRSVEAAFPLLYAIEQERGIASGQRLAAEGQFDPTVKASGINQTGTFANGRFDAGVEQATPFSGMTTYAGWRWGPGNFPIYYGERKTADGGEFRAGVSVPLLQNRAIDPRRAKLRAAQIAEQLADPVIRRARIDYFRAAAQAYWSWQAAGGDYRVAQYLLRIANERQTFLDTQFKEGAVNEVVVVLNRRIVAGREGTLLAAERHLQRTALRLSLYLRDAGGNPVVPGPEWLLAEFIEMTPSPPDATQLAADVARAYSARPELVRFQLEKERRAVELQLAQNQLTPELNAYAQVAQDVGGAKKTFTGVGAFRTDRTTAEVGAQFEMPLPFRNARGLTRTAQAQLAQLLAQERYARDTIAAEVQDAVSALELTYRRLDRAREELKQAERVLAQTSEQVRLERITLVELNIQETAVAEARSKVVSILGAYFAAIADYRAALGFDGTRDAGNEPPMQAKPPVRPDLLPEPRPVP